MKAPEIAKEINEMLAHAQQAGMTLYDLEAELINDARIGQPFVELFIYGGGIILKEDGTWCFYDTSGG